MYMTLQMTNSPILCVYDDQTNVNCCIGSSDRYAITKAFMYHEEFA